MAPDDNIGIDSVEAHDGLKPYDPSKNVLDLVKAESRYQDAMRGELDKRFDVTSKAISDHLKLVADSAIQYQNAQRDSETRRIDQLAQTRQEFQNTIRDMLAESVRTTSTLVSTQLVQIQATFDTRVSKLEAGAFTQAGKQSVADPVISDAITRLSIGQSTLRTNTEDAMARMVTMQNEQMAKLTTAINALGTVDAKTASTRMGQGQVIAWIVAGVMLISSIVSPLVAYLAMRGK